MALLKAVKARIRRNAIKRIRRWKDKRMRERMEQMFGKNGLGKMNLNFDSLLPTGFKKFDQTSGGFKRGELFAITSPPLRPSEGKSDLMGSLYRRLRETHGTGAWIPVGPLPKMNPIDTEPMIFGMDPGAGRDMTSVVLHINKNRRVYPEHMRFKLDFSSLSISNAALCSDDVPKIVGQINAQAEAEKIECMFQQGDVEPMIMIQPDGTRQIVAWSLVDNKENKYAEEGRTTPDRPEQGTSVPLE